jgi:hypothetical protein
MIWFLEDLNVPHMQESEYRTLFMYFDPKQEGTIDWNQLVNMIRTRKYRRSAEIQDEIVKLYRQEVVGYRGPQITYNKYDDSGKKSSSAMLIDGDGRICFEPQNPGFMLFENLRPDKFQDLDFFENDFFTRLNLNEISFLATDQPGFFGKDSEIEDQEYTIKVFGPMTKQSYLSKEKENQTTEFAGLSPLRKIPYDLFTVTIHNLKFPLSFVKKNNHKGFVRVRITQGVGKDPSKDADDNDWIMDERKRFTVLSSDFRLEFNDSQFNQDNESFEMKLPGLQFFLAPLYERSKERFTVEVLYYSNICPVPTVVKDFMFENVWESQDGFAGVEFL